MQDLRKKYFDLFGKKVPNNKKNNSDWIQGKILQKENEKTIQIDKEEIGNDEVEICKEIIRNVMHKGKIYQKGELISGEIADELKLLGFCK